MRYIEVMDIYTLCGWIGMAIIVVTYYFVTSGKWGPHTKIDEVMNITGSVLVGINVYHTATWPAFTLQIIWIFVAMLSLSGKMKTSPTK